MDLLSQISCKMADGWLLRISNSGTWIHITTPLKFNLDVGWFNTKIVVGNVSNVELVVFIRTSKVGVLQG